MRRALLVRTIVTQYRLQKMSEVLLAIILSFYGLNGYFGLFSDPECPADPIDNIETSSPLMNVELSEGVASAGRGSFSVATVLCLTLLTI